MPFEFGDVVLVPFPDQPGGIKEAAHRHSQQRRLHNRTKRDVVVMAITSQFRPSSALGEGWLSEWQAAGLLKPSAIKPVFATLEQSLIIRQFGTLAAADQAALRRP